MRSSLEFALAIIAAHPTWYVFPIEGGRKEPPRIRDNLNQASNDPTQIEAWHKKWPACNWGLALAKSHAVVIDVDCKLGKDGQKTFDDLNLLYGFPKTMTCSTPSGGLHHYYEGEHVFALGTNGFGKDVDSPNYVLLPGCELSDPVTGLTTHYKLVNDVPVVAAPQWFYEFLGKPRERGENADAVAVVELDQEENKTRMEEWLKDGAPPAIEGRGGDMVTLKVAMRLRDEGISRTMAKSLMADHYNVPFTCEPLWDEAALDQKVDNAYDYASLNRPGEKTAEAEFAADPIPTNAAQDAAVAADAAKRKVRDDAAVERKARDAAAEAELKKLAKQVLTKNEVAQMWVYITQQEQFMRRSDSFTLSKRAFDNAFAYIPKAGKLSDHLLKAKVNTIRQFDSYDYAPGQGEFALGDRYNMWRPSDVVPAAGDTTLWDQHLEYLFPDESDRDHVLNWLGWVLQNIGRKPKHMLVIQGEQQGTGKSFIGDVFQRLIGRENTTQLRDQLTTGNFNGWAKRAKLIVIEEVRQAGRSGVARALHDMITQETLTINEKNVPHYSIRDVIAYLGFTNKSDAMAMDDSDRRYLIVRTPAIKQDVPYYQALFNGLLFDYVALAADDPSYNADKANKDAAAKLSADRALAAVAHKLMTRDLAGYDAAAPAPFTSAKGAMIAEGRTDLERWIVEELGNVPLCWRMVCVSRDVIPQLPPHIVRGQSSIGLARHLADALRRLAKGEDLPGQVSVGREQVRLMALHGHAGVLKGLSTAERAVLYRKQREAAAKGASVDAASDFGPE